MTAARQRAMVVGASSGIGEALARELADAGYDVGLTARRRELLEDLGRVLPTKAYVARTDVTETEAARETFQEVCDAMGGVDVVVLNAGVAFENPDLEWEPERDTVDTNVRGFTALATAAMDRFEDQGHGHLVGVSSVAARFGNGEAPAYGASKAFVSNYLEGLRYRTGRLDADVDVTTVEPGYVDTDLAGGDFWKADRETAAEQIRRAIEKKRRHAYITRRWVLIAKLIDYMPDVLKRRLFR
ncbi:SDR family NAD(P)-dependent oxidoreductase [Halorientalis pallida]|uniref:SDR family NAD(P)-dependent oxidoreductase n=1 Tax=Halorientalis pallida TaxID=2479928 RepID=A0A498KYC3_9EURY|nr:SDR family NAD(P)-dependent oxidoreductase [Halorientalis pallida]RXK50339.1 SDR family NAD(P)-dependent oxidoreductase [Halorientalis pallida]